MTVICALVRNCRGAAAAEMALVAPILILIMFGSAELGRYFYHEHILVKSLRDGAVFASRAPIDNFNCTSLAINQAVVTNTTALVRTGGLSGQSDLLPWWTLNTATFTMTLACPTSAGGTVMEGIYTANGGKVPVITLNASLPYQPFFASSTMSSLNASAQTAVLGI